MHTCPRRGCTTQLPDRLFACRGDWYALSRETRRLIWNTAGLPLTSVARALAVRKAGDEWKALDDIQSRITKKEETE